MSHRKRPGAVPENMQDVSEYYRYCPDQPKQLISDSVCLGRRRSRYPHCAGCQFNDDERGPAVAARESQQRAAQKLNAIEELFASHDIRAEYPDPLDEDVAWRIGHATASYYRSALRGLDRSDPVATTVIVGRDMRPSSATLCEALAEGARSTGAGVIDVGMIDTPQLCFAINHLGSGGGVQVTGACDPIELNGFFFAGRGGRPVGPDTGLVDICRIARNMVRHDTGQSGPLETLDLAGEYRSFLRSQLAAPRPLKVIVDASNGMAARWVPLVLDDVESLELICLNTEHDGRFAHPPDPLVEGNLRQLRGEVRNTGADLGVCFGGGASRLVLVDEQGDVVRPDILTALLARQLLSRSPGATVVYDLCSSRVVAEEIKAAGGAPRRERVGSVFMKKALAESRGVFGGERSGHYYYEHTHYCASGLLTLIEILNALTRDHRPLSEQVRPLLRYAATGERRFENTTAEATIRRLADQYGDARVDFLDGVTVQYEDWWFNVRRGAGENLLLLSLEASTPELLERRLSEVAGHLGTPMDS